MSEKKPTPFSAQPSGKMCPVCGTRSYSQGGIHPQSAVHQADAARTEELKAARKLQVAEAKPSTWRSKKCAKCNKESHVRRKMCECGHTFF